jgi:hypothetical protein
VHFGGLRRFIQDQCTGRVVYVGAKGGDAIYAHVSKLGIQIQLESKSALMPTPWATFVDPNVRGQLAVDPILGSLHVYSAEEQCPQSLVPVDKLSLEEHRIIAKEFLPFIPVASQSSFESALRENAFWPKWRAAFNSLADRELFPHWMKWRCTKIMTIFEQRLRSVGISDQDLVSAITSKFKESKQIKVASTKSTSAMVPTRFRRSVGDSSNSRSGATDVLLRKIAHLAIDSMSDRDIGRIWMPLGALNDALQRNK